MRDYRFSIIIRCSDDTRIFDLLAQIDTDKYQVLVGLTPNLSIEQQLTTLGIPYVSSEKGNTAITTNRVLPYVVCDYVLLLDSDCLLYSGCLARFYGMIVSKKPDLITPKIDFKSTNFSTYLSSIQRHFQYSAFDFIYEPCLLINLKSVLPQVGGYLFSESAIFTPDGELNHRIKKSNYNFIILKDQEFSIKHRPLGYYKNLKSHWRYGKSEVNILKNTGENIIKTFFSNPLARYSKALSFIYPLFTLPTVLLCDMVSLLSFYYYKNKEGL